MTTNDPPPREITATQPVSDRYLAVIDQNDDGIEVVHAFDAPEVDDLIDIVQVAENGAVDAIQEEPEGTEARLARMREVLCWQEIQRGLREANVEPDAAVVPTEQPGAGSSITFSVEHFDRLSRTETVSAGVLGTLRNLLGHYEMSPEIRRQLDGCVADIENAFAKPDARNHAEASDTTATKPPRELN